MRSALLSFLSLVLPAAAAAQGMAPAPLSVHPLTPTVYWIEGGGGNSGVIVGEHSVIVIDAKMTPTGGRQLLDCIAAITPKPVTTVLLTHSDMDHVNGLAAFPAGVEIVAHENAAKEMRAAIAANDPRAPPADRLPTRILSASDQTLVVDGITLEVFHWAPAHTSGDLVVFLPKEKIVFAGDIETLNFPNPLIHLEKNGSSLGWIATARAMTALDADRFVPGHGDVQTREALDARTTAATEKRLKIAELVAQGRSLDQIKAQLDPPAAQPPGVPRFPSYTEVVYRELTAPSH
jgi:glyoxylase-like metal-dependent hydrolase (beta-lactamase superfamily II)